MFFSLLLSNELLHCSLNYGFFSWWLVISVRKYALHCSLVYFKFLTVFSLFHSSSRARYDILCLVLCNVLRKVSNNFIGLSAGDFPVRRFHVRLDYQEHREKSTNTLESALFAIVARSSQGLLMFTVIGIGLINFLLVNFIAGGSMAGRGCKSLADVALRRGQPRDFSSRRDGKAGRQWRWGFLKIHLNMKTMEHGIKKCRERH